MGVVTTRIIIVAVAGMEVTVVVKVATNGNTLTAKNVSA